MKWLVRKISVYSSLAYFYIRRAIKEHPRFRKSWTFHPGSAALFEKTLAEVPAEKVFLHVALSSIKRFSNNEDPYVYLRDLLSENFRVVTSQAFTPAVRKTKYFDPRETPPAFGQFAKLFFRRDATFRNLDPCYSVIAQGDHGLNENDLTFTPNGIFRQMIEQDYYCINIGLDYITCSLIHLIEYEQRVPYRIFYKDRFTLEKDGQTEEIGYTLHKGHPGYGIKGYVWWNKIRTNIDLLRRGIVRKYYIHGVPMYVFSLKALHRFITEKVKKDPYYLIKW